VTFRAPHPRSLWKEPVQRGRSANDQSLNGIEEQHASRHSRFGIDGTPDEAAKGADAVLMAKHCRIDDALHQAVNLSGKVIVTYLLDMARSGKPVR
jgi:hypothetical protein